MKRPTKLGLASVALALVACATAKGPFAPYSQTPGYHAIGTSVYGYLEKDIDGDGLPDVVVVRQDNQGGYRLQVMERRDPGGEKWSKTCDTDPIKGEDVVQITWLGDPNARQLAMLVVGDENPEEIVQHFVVMNPDSCKVEWADMLTVPRREMPVMRSSAMPPEGLSLAADGNVLRLRLVDHSELVGLQGQEGPVGLLARYRERVGVMQDGHMTVAESTQAVLLKRDVKVTWEPHERDAGVQHLAALSDGRDDTLFALPAGQSGRLTIDSEEAFVLLELHHGCDVGGDEGLTLEHSGRAYTTGTTPPDHAPFRAAGRRHPREKAYTQELLALHDALHVFQLDLPKSDSVRCVREVAAYGWQ